MFKLEKFYAQGFDPQQYWDDRYSREHIAGKSSDQFRQQGFWPLLQKYFPKDKRRYLDAGCGMGGWVIFLKEEGYDVEGIDVAARTVRALTEYDPDLKVKIAPITAIPYADVSFDGLLAIGTLEYEEDQVPQALREVHRVLKDGGIFFLEVPVANLVRRFVYIPLKKVEKIFRQARTSRPTFSNYLFDRGELHTLLNAAGFEVLEERPHELPDKGSHYGLYIDWPFLRGSAPYKLNTLGRAVKTVCNALSPWVASTGMVMVVRKR